MPSKTFLGHARLQARYGPSSRSDWIACPESHAAETLQTVATSAHQLIGLSLKCGSACQLSDKSRSVAIGEGSKRNGWYKSYLPG